MLGKVGKPQPDPQSTSLGNPSEDFVYIRPSIFIIILFYMMTF